MKIGGGGGALTVNYSICDPNQWWPRWDFGCLVPQSVLLRVPGQAPGFRSLCCAGPSPEVVPRGPGFARGAWPFIEKLPNLSMCVCNLNFSEAKKSNLACFNYNNLLFDLN